MYANITSTWMTHTSIFNNIGILFLDVSSVAINFGSRRRLPITQEVAEVYSAAVSYFVGSFRRQAALSLNFKVVQLVMKSVFSY